ncbi:aminotransferase class I/II-fold pyridoxal phosphate-dependent enzyme [Prochlorococcus sp. AH-716-I07]|nr:aminotransferase class I/II-fold pyridoxal phosphate-dependent enzyme [Prochlorococcus sp. AH-716-I07]
MNLMLGCTIQVHIGFMQSDIRLSRSDIKIKDYISVINCLRDGMLGMGKYVKDFEDLLQDYFSSNVVCVSSGTSALHLALEALNFERGSEVLVPSLTYLATFQAIKAAGLKPRPVDIDITSGNINIENLDNAFNSSCKAIIPVLYAGNTSHYRDILQWANKKSLRVISDAAHAFGSKDSSELVGSFGDITCFSFDGIKNITSGEGGCVVSQDLNLINTVKDKRLLSVNKDSEMRYTNKRSWEFDVYSQGWRYHMSNVHASIGISQFKRRNKFFKKRQLIAKYYDTLLSNSKVVSIFKRNYDEVVPHIYPVIIKSGFERKYLIEYLNQQKIQVGIHYKPNHQLTYFKSEDSLVNTEKLYPKLLSLPLHTLLSFKQVRYIVSKINSYSN